MRITAFIRNNPVFIVVALCLLSRLPQLISPELYCDGDECVVALMAQKMYEGKELSFYFWGQRYGFAFFECLSILPFYLLFGYSIVAVKLGILSLWTIGTALLFKVVYKLMHNKLYPSIVLIAGFNFVSCLDVAIHESVGRPGYIIHVFKSHFILTYL